MPTESSRDAAARRNDHVECTLDNDPRLIAAVGTVVGNAAERAGLPESVRDSVAAAAVETCHKMFTYFGNNGNTPNAIKLAVTDFPDRVEVSIDAGGKASPAAGSTEANGNPLESLKADRVRCEIREGRVRLTLVKQCGEAKSSHTA